MTTCRSLAEEATKIILARLGQPVTSRSSERLLPGGANFPAGEAAQRAVCESIALESGRKLDQVSAVWTLLGSRTAAVLASLGGLPTPCVFGTPFPRDFVTWVIRQEWVTHLADLVERRLMLLFAEPLTTETLRELAELLVEEGRLARSAVDAEITVTAARLRDHFGKRIDGAVSAVSAAG